MELADYLAILRKYWASVLGVAIIGVVVAAVVSLLTTPTYTATASVFVTVQSGGTAADLNQGSTYAENQVKSFAQVVTMPVVLDPVISELGLDVTTAQLAQQITVTIPTNTAVIQVAVVDTDAIRTAQIANAVANQLVSTIGKLAPAGTNGEQTVVASVVAPSAVPLTWTSPRVTLNLGLGVLIGFLIGFGQAVVRARLDTRVVSEEDLAELTDRPAMGVITFEVGDSPRPLILHAEPHSHWVEAYRRLRTNLQFLNLEGRHRVVVITSSLAGEGKTTTSINLATTLADAGESVLLIDADLRKPDVANYLGLEAAAGLSTVIIGKAELDDVVQSVGHADLWVLTSGEMPPNPSELLGSESMKRLLAEAAERYDTIILDAPPLLPVTDAAVLAGQAAGALLVAGSGTVKAPELLAAIDSIERIGGEVLGLVLNKVQASSAGYGDYAYHGDDSTSSGEPVSAKRADSAAEVPGATMAARSAIRGGIARAAVVAEKFTPKLPRTKQTSRKSASQTDAPRAIQWIKSHPVRTATMGVIVILLGATAWVGWQVSTQVSALGHLRDNVATMSASNGDEVTLKASTTAALSNAAAAKAASQDPLVLAAGRLPWVGDNIGAVGAVSRTAGNLAESATGAEQWLPQVLGGEKPSLATAAQVAPLSEKFAAAADLAVADLDRANTPALLPSVRSQLVSIRDSLSQVSPTVARVSPYLRAVSILSTSGTHDWFVVMQNLDEARPSGGMISNWMVLHSENGTLTLVSKGANGELLKTGAVGYQSVMPQAYQDLWGDSMSDWRSLNLSANFPDNAKLMAQAWNKHHAYKVDGVLALGQGSVKYLAAAAGPITVDGRTIKPADMTDYLTVGVYRDFANPKKVDAVVTQISSEVLRRALSGQVDVKSLLTVASSEDSADYLQMWAAHAGTQEQIETAGLSGTFGAAEGPVASVRLANGGGNKIDAFMHLDVDYSLSSCSVDTSGKGMRTGTLTTTLSNAAPTSGLPAYMTPRSDLTSQGVAAKDIVAGSNLDYVIVYAPRGAVVQTVTQDGVETTVPQTLVGDREMLVVSADLNPGQKTTITVTWAEQAGDSNGQQYSTAPRVVLPPLINQAQVTTQAGGVCR
jgi:polysaccharide biosynthesis transport protein